MACKTIMLLCYIYVMRSEFHGRPWVVYGLPLVLNGAQSARDLNTNGFKDNCGSVSEVINYVVENFLDDCGLYLLYDPRHMKEEEIQMIIRNLKQSLMLVSLLSLEESQQYYHPLQQNKQEKNKPHLTQLKKRRKQPQDHLKRQKPLLEQRQPQLAISNDTILTPFKTCSAYFIMSDDVEGIRSIIFSSNFNTKLHYLGRYVFVTGESNVESAKIILDNEVMAWRPHAIVITKNTKDCGGDSKMVERWVRGKPQRYVNLFQDKLNNFHQNELKGVTFEHAPSVIEVIPTAVTTKDMSAPHFDGIDIRLLMILSEALNFSLRIVTPSDGGKWGSSDENGDWSGLTGDLIHRRAHMGVANLFIHVHYLKVVDMTVPYDLEFGCFITPLPGDLPQWMALVYPFSSQVWIYTFIFLVLGTPILYFSSLLARLLLGDESSWVTNLYHIVFYGTGIFFGVGMPREPRSDVTRSYFIMWVWYGFLLTTIYRSALTAFLTVPLAQPPINSLQQLVSSSIPSWGSTGLTFKKILLENPDTTVQRLADRYHPVNSAEEGIHLTAQRKYAMMENRQFLEYTIATNFTNQYGEETLHVMKECFLPFKIGMALPKGAPYRPNFDRVITRVVEAGLVRKWFKDILHIHKKRGDRTEGSTDNNKAFTLNNLQGAWLILGGGLLLSLMVFLMEIALRSATFVME